MSAQGAPTPTFRATERAFHVEAWERMAYDLLYVDGAFDPANPELAEAYRGHGRVLVVIDRAVHALLDGAVEAYFAAHGVTAEVVALHVPETAKTLATVERVVDAMDAFGLLRTEPVLVVGGGLLTDVAGLACATYRRGTPYVRVPTTLIGLIDASVSIKVGVNHGRHKNRLGAYHPSRTVVLDPSLLATLPTDQVRNGMAEIAKIAVVAHRGVFEALERHGEDLLATGFGQRGATPEVAEAARWVVHEAIRTMLELEVPNLHELDLDRVIAFGHTWSPVLELAPERPFFHGQAISIDMALSTTIARRRGLVGDDEHARVLGLFSRLGLAVGSDLLTPELLLDATRSILRTRDGRLRAAVPAPVGTCAFLDDLDDAELLDALAEHRALVADLPRGGDGVDAHAPADPREGAADLDVDGGEGADGGEMAGQLAGAGR